MNSKSVWTTDEAAANLGRVLKQARERGPQQIKDDTGIYILKLLDDRSKDDMAKKLLRLRPKS